MSPWKSFLSLATKPIPHGWGKDGGSKWWSCMLTGSFTNTTSLDSSEITFRKQGIPPSVFSRAHQLILKHASCLAHLLRPWNEVGTFCVHSWHSLTPLGGGSWHHEGTASVSCLPLRYKVKALWFTEGNISKEIFLKAEEFSKIVWLFKEKSYFLTVETLPHDKINF